MRVREKEGEPRALVWARYLLDCAVTGRVNEGAGRGWGRGEGGAWLGGGARRVRAGAAQGRHGGGAATPSAGGSGRHGEKCGEREHPEDAGSGATRRPGGIGKLGRERGGHVRAPGLTRDRFLLPGLGYVCSAALKVIRREALRAQPRRTTRPSPFFGQTCASSFVPNPEGRRARAPPPLPRCLGLTLPPNRPLCVGSYGTLTNQATSELCCRYLVF